MSLRAPPDWLGPSDDPNDVQFGDVVEPTTLDDAGEYDAVLVGEPYDGAVIGRPGAAEAPAAVRDSLAGVKAHHYETGPVAGVGDLGDVPLPDDEEDVAAVQDAVAETTQRVHEADAFPVFLGGDNSLTVANVRPLLGGAGGGEGRGHRRGGGASGADGGGDGGGEGGPGGRGGGRGGGDGRVGVVSLDAHLDCREPTDGPTSGTPYRRLFEAGLDALSVVGARHFETSTAYADFLAERGGTAFTPADVRADPSGIAAAAVEALGDVDRVYVSLDVDVLDVAAAPGVSAPTPGGVRTSELYELVRSVLRDERVVGFEVVECAPPLDRGGRTVAAASRAVAHALAGVTARA
ncbi:arginase family protein [Halorarum salinum]|uniref:Arginase family protein n=1 Tax=Halorarum salinum TaxID=2743089 RepID=A0A7D5LDS7_9EURY|nr:arginase family protein [Halobaculum salinum]QLG64290.1 arginase family protein [Halobaculum salinum]